ncbi:ABC transporter substrate-binding protein [Megalodesulfovibrio gigas]|uniref:Putative amino acid ABC transporter substrate-binding protein n=1 Tax=Megalodesulfovibrio gigas (strain ATCC 19364 / DSM 1382 / NCIMB 9332 / VKM B-1759) TaxID=1121448 RepID=T2GD70_MEGG1|nr:ABC transporter substrate-binding protein [Megalodesulfovibrio gigas]AGW13867.1 putative amino acid ABC transporter substrate-binding protein [Megalodesulfovibrio gigas DSM 1382 = ATCC 19364]
MRKVVKLLALSLAMLVLAAPAFAGKLESIKAAGVLKAGVKDSQVPFGYVDEKTSKIVGFEIDLMQALADKLGVKLDVKPVTSATRIPMLTQGDIDIIAATMTHKKEREDQIDFSITYFQTGQKLLVKKDGGVKTVADLAGKKVGSAKGSTSEQNVKKAQPECTVVSFETYPEAFLALKQGKVQAVTTDESILLGLKNSDEKSGDYEIVGEYISPEPYGLGMVENDSDFRDFVNLTLMELWETGKFQTMYTKWFGKDTPNYIPLDWKLELWP